MNKHLKVEVNGQEWVNGEFSEISFTDGPNGVKIEAKVSRAGGGGGGGLLEMLTGASKARTELVVDQKRASLRQEKAEPVVEVVEAEPVE